MARRLPGADVDYVGAQNRDGGYSAAEHLYGHGCRRITFVGGFADASAREERAGGLSTFLAEHDLALDRYGSVTCEPLRPPARETAMRLLTDHPEIGALLLECSDMPPYAKQIQDATGLPVWDYVTLIDWIHSSVVRHSYDGFI